MTGLKVPYNRKLSLSPGSSVTIKGAPTVSFTNHPQMQLAFYIDNSEHSDIAFNFQVNFGSSVVMNSRENGIWGSEETSYLMPFINEQDFVLRIMVQPDKYQVIANGEQCFTFGHRRQPQTVKMMQVWGDVSLTSVDVS